MRPLPQPPTTNALYAALRATAVAAAGPLGAPVGSVIQKTIKRGTYLYFQVRDLDGRTRQLYLGPDNEQTQGLVGRLQSRGHAREEQELARLQATFLASGGAALPSGPMHVIAAFARAGVFAGGAEVTLIGTPAFHCLGNLLGVRWPAALHTHDVDPIELGVGRPDTKASELLEQLQMGLLPMPSLDAKSPSTSYRIRGQALRVDLLTPLIGKASGPRFVPAFGAPAEPVRHLDYLLESTVMGLAIGPRELAVVRLPHPARFALHKLMISTLRPVACATKSEADRAQALQVLLALADAGSDDVDDAARELVERGKAWSSKARQALDTAEKRWPDEAAVVRPLLTRLYAK